MAEYKGIKAVLRQFYVLLKKILDDTSNALSTKIESVENSLADVKVDADHFEGTLPISKGGTGATTAKTGFINLAEGLTEASNPEDGETMIYRNSSGTNWGRHTFLTLWNYIKKKLATEMGFSASLYSGMAAKATTAYSMSNSYYNSGASTSYTISTFLEKLVSLGVITRTAEYTKPFRFRWAYAYNGTLSTDYGNITLAGTQIIFLGRYDVDPTTSGENSNNFDIIFQCNPNSNPAGQAVTLKYTCRSGSFYGPKWTLYNCSRRTVIPTSQPSTVVNGDIWIK